MSAEPKAAHARAGAPADIVYTPVAVVGTKTTAVGAAFVVLGVIGFIAGLARGEALTVWGGYLVNLLFFLSVAQGAVIVSVSYYLAQGRWAGTAQFRLAEAY